MTNGENMQCGVALRWFNDLSALLSERRKSRRNAIWTPAFPIKLLQTEYFSSVEIRGLK